MKTYPFWYPGILAAVAAVAVIALTFHEPRKMTEESRFLQGGGDSGKGATAPAEMDKETGILWSHPVKGLSMGLRLVNEFNRPQTEYLPGEPVNVEIYLKNEADATLNLITAKERGSDEWQQNHFPFLFPLRPLLHLGEKKLTDPVEEPAFPLGVNLSSIFSVNSLTHGVTFKTIRPAFAFCRPYAWDESFSETGNIVAPGEYRLAISYHNTLTETDKISLWSGALEVSVPLRIAAPDWQNPDQSEKAWDCLLKGPVMRVDDLPFVFGKTYKGFFRTTQDSWSVLWVGDRLATCHLAAGINCQVSDLLERDAISPADQPFLFAGFLGENRIGFSGRDGFLGLLINPTDRPIEVPVISDSGMSYLEFLPEEGPTGEVNLAWTVKLHAVPPKSVMEYFTTG